MNPDDKKSENWRDNDPNKEISEKWKKDPNNWKFQGLLYNNKEDKRLFVPKKSEWMGTTINFANPKWVRFIIGFMFFFGFVIWTIAAKNNLF
jgi:uncharacterized membrane protein